MDGRPKLTRLSNHFTGLRTNSADSLYDTPNDSFQTRLEAAIELARRCNGVHCTLDKITYGRSCLVTWIKAVGAGGG